MQFSKLLIITPVVFFAMGCSQTRSLTEEYIKTKVESHEPETHGSIRTYTIFKSMAGTSSPRYIELTGYKYNGVKGMVIGADRYFKLREKTFGLTTVGTEVMYVQLSEAECRTMFEKQPELKSLSQKSPRVIMSEEAYQDYTVNDRVFMSYRKAAGSSSAAKLDIWVDGHKFTMSTMKFVKKMGKFLKY